MHKFVGTKRLDNHEAMQKVLVLFQQCFTSFAIKTSTFFDEFLLKPKLVAYRNVCVIMRPSWLILLYSWNDLTSHHNQWEEMQIILKNNNASQPVFKFKVQIFCINAGRMVKQSLGCTYECVDWKSRNHFQNTCI